MNVDRNRVKDALLNFLIPLICLGITLLIFFTIIFPAINNLPTLRVELETQMTLENQLRSKLASLNKLIDFSEELEENSQVITKVLVDEPDVPLLLTQIDSIAKESGLTINKLSYSFGEAGEDESLLSYKFVNVSLGAFGTYDQITVFMKNLENSARLVDIATFRYSVENSKDTTGIFNATFILRSPYLKVESKAVTDDPINIDIGDPTFVAVMDKLRSLRFYDTNINIDFTNIQESTPAELEESIPEDVPVESNVPQSQIDEIIAQ